MVKEIKTVFKCKPDRLKFKTIPVCNYQKDIDDEIVNGSLIKLVRSHKDYLKAIEETYSSSDSREELEEVASG